MELNDVPDSIRIQLSELVAQRIGLHFPPKRWPDLQRSLTLARADLGFADFPSFAEWLLSTPLSKSQIDVLATHLTIGETYFFREKRTLEVLGKRVLPELIRSRCNTDRRLRIWSAGCCTGEEPYSLAILLHQLIPDLAKWFVTITATDINPHFLRKAAAGVYGEWSFRETTLWLKERYFRKTSDCRYEILPDIKRLVTFAQLNLAEDLFPSLTTETNAMDVIFCRNVLMYFSPTQAERVVCNLNRALIPEGWLIVSPSETSQVLFSNFRPVNFPRVTFYQKRDSSRSGRSSTLDSTIGDFSGLESAFESSLEAPIPPDILTEPSRSPAEEPEQLNSDPPSRAAASLYKEGRYKEVVDILLPLFRPHVTEDSEAFSLLTRALANQGQLREAVMWCARWVAADKLNCCSHYVHALILQELGDSKEALRSLQRALYLKPDFVLAHFALGNIARECGKSAEVARHFGNASRLLHNYQPTDVLPESDGLTAGRLIEIMTSINLQENMS